MLIGKYSQLMEKVMETIERKKRSRKSFGFPGSIFARDDRIVS
jgi:hypothetical protein